MALSARPGRRGRVCPIRSSATGCRTSRIALDRGQPVLAGILFGLACTARLTVVFGRRSSCSSAVAAIDAVAASRRSSAWRSRSGILVAYTYATTGHLTNPGYDFLYSIETVFYPQLDYHRGLGDRGPALPRPEPAAAGRGCPTSSAVRPGAVRGLFDATCPVIAPRDVGMGLFLTSPAWLLAFASLRWFGRDRLVTGRRPRGPADRRRRPHALQPGLGPVRLSVQQRLRAVRACCSWPSPSRPARRLRRIGYVLIALSIAIVAWGVTWGHLFGW